MLFSSMTFLWLFLPTVFIIHTLLPDKAKNFFLLAASLFFYSWGEPVYILLMLSSIAINYLAAIVIDCTKTKKTARRMIFILDIFINIGLLWYFKYYDSFAALTNSLLHKTVFTVKDIALPIGISFYTFQILSYVIDVYLNKCDIQKNLVKFALYVSFFPQLIAGPIVKYRDVAEQIENRKIDSRQIFAGIKRFIYGLSKKVILSNTIAEVADSIFEVSVEVIDTKWLWVGALLYTLQIYYDFSGYSDMAIGLGRMFGFEFPENFNYPYVSTSIREFWRRWHISLSSWFKEYIYIPLGGNRKGKYRTYINLAIVFVVTGVWHGATLNFLLWGCFHGFFILVEKAFLGKKLESSRFKLFNHLYTLFAVTVGWAIFRCSSLKEALKLVFYMFRWQNHNFYVWYDFFSIRSLFVVGIAVALIGFLQERCKRFRTMLYDTARIYYPEALLQAVLLVLCIVLLIGGQYNPFIYFKF
ncbi:MAG: MBOAT family protein [bacterium]|nr:MBOAT family protein [bacterium]MCM1499436.1 MBOAT family protein [Clostridium sp.]